LLKGHLLRGDEVKTLYPSRPEPVRDRGSRHRRTFAVEFSKTGAASD